MTENAQNPAAQNSNNAIDSDPNADKGFGAVDAGGVSARNPQTGERQKKPTEAAPSSSDKEGRGSDWLGGPQNGNEAPGNGGNGGNGGNSSGSGDGGDGDATKVGSAYWQF